MYQFSEVERSAHDQLLEVPDPVDDLDDCHCIGCDPARWANLYEPPPIACNGYDCQCPTFHLVDGLAPVRMTFHTPLTDNICDVADTECCGPYGCACEAACLAAGGACERFPCHHAEGLH